MKTQVRADDALFLGCVENSFKGRDGKQVTYRKVTFLDNDNNHVEATLDKDEPDPTLTPRQSAVIDYEIDIQTRGDAKSVRIRVLKIHE